MLDDTEQEWSMDCLRWRWRLTSKVRVRERPRNRVQCRALEEGMLQTLLDVTEHMEECSM